MRFISVTLPSVEDMVTSVATPSAPIRNSQVDPVESWKLFPPMWERIGGDTSAHSGTATKKSPQAVSTFHVRRRSPSLA